MLSGNILAKRRVRPILPNYIAFGCILWDMSDYYEHIPRPLLRDRGDISAFPAHIMDLSIPMYGATRILTLETLAKPMGRPGRVVIAGCTAATYHVHSFAAPLGFAQGGPHPH